MKKIFFFATILISIVLSKTYAQSITLSPTSQNMIEANSTNQGVLFPRMNSSQRTALLTPANGLLVYDTNTNSFWYSQNGIWTELPKSSLWSVNGIAGNEISNNNSGGFWSSNPTIVPYPPNNLQQITAPTSGAGTRLMWIPSRSAFRCGTVNGEAWDAANIGLHSFASGYNSRATGVGNIAMGLNSVSDGTSNTIAFGENTQATGQNGVAIGYGARSNAQFGVAIGNNAFADGTSNTLSFGENTNASGTNGVSIGTGTNANAYYSMALGYYNNILPSASATAWVAEDPLFTIGNGQSNVLRSNAMMILKNGNIGIGTSPITLLHSHQANNTSKNVMKFTNTLSGLSTNDGLDIGFEPNIINARLWNYENGSLSLGTNNIERINISSSGNVGIGGPSTGGYKLYVNGPAAITGTVLLPSLSGTGNRPVFVDANGFLMEGTSTPTSTTNTYSKYHNVSSANARNIGSTSSTNFTYMATACLAYFSSLVKRGDGQIVMPVEFPDDAILAEMALHVVDNVDNNFMEARLIRVPRIGTSTTQVVLATVNSATLASDVKVQEVIVSISPAIQVKNKDFYYYILVDISSDGANWGSTALALRGVRFKYSITY